MALFFVPAETAQEAGSGAGSGPSTSDFFEVTCLGVEELTGDKFKEGSFRLRLQFETGDEGGELISASHDADGNPLAGLTAEKVIGRVKFLNGIMESFGFTAEQRNAGGYSDEWLVNAVGYVEWHAAADLGAQYGKVARWIRKDEYETARGAGRKPVIGRARSGAPGGRPGAPASGASAPRPGAPAAAPANGTRPPAPPTGAAPRPAAASPRPPAPPTARGVA